MLRSSITRVQPLPVSLKIHKIVFLKLPPHSARYDTIKVKISFISAFGSNRQTFSARHYIDRIIFIYINITSVMYIVKRPCRICPYASVTILTFFVKNQTKCNKKPSWCNERKFLITKNANLLYEAEKLLTKSFKKAIIYLHKFLFYLTSCILQKINWELI